MMKYFILILYRTYLMTESNSSVKPFKKLLVESIIKRYSDFSSNKLTKNKIKCNAFLDFITLPDRTTLKSDINTLALILDSIILIVLDPPIIRNDVSFWEFICIDDCYKLIRLCILAPQLTLLRINSGGFTIKRTVSNDGERILYSNELTDYNENWKTTNDNNIQMKQFFDFVLKRNTLVCLFDMKKDFAMGGIVRHAINNKFANLDQILYSIEVSQIVIHDDEREEPVYQYSEVYSVERYLTEIARGTVATNWEIYRNSVNHPELFDVPHNY